MSESPQKFYLTTPIYYVNARPHIGHAYTTIVADVLARRHRLLGDDTFFLTGTDEHGQKIERSATAAGIPPQQFADQVSQQFRDLWDRMGLTYTAYIRTTDPAHKAGVQHLFQTLYDKGFIYLDKYTGSYCVSDEAFVDAPVGTPCPDCGRLLEEVTEENFFFKLSAFQEKLLNLIESNDLLIEPTTARNEVLSFLRGNAPAAASSTGLAAGFSPLNNAVENEGASAPGLLTTAAGTPYTPGALKDLSISRSSFTWGIPVPKEVQEAAGATQPHVIYVWLDALANYMTALGYPDGPNFQKFWPADLHLVGKEITRFHCVYWPAFLMAAGIPTPKRITANGWLLFDNSKMSKSKGNVVRTETILEGFGRLCPPVFTGSKDNAAPKGISGAAVTPGLEGGFSPPSKPAEKGALAPGFSEPTRRDRDLFASDVLRYFLLREIPFGQDGSFSFEAMVTRYNADLANGYGNLVSRTLTLVHSNFENKIPHISAEYLVQVQRSGIDDPAEAFKQGTPEIIDVISVTREACGQLMDKCSFAQALSNPFLTISAIDQYFSNQTPWKLAKNTDEISRAKLAEVLYTAAEALRIITAQLYPVLPHATAAVWRQLGLGDIEQAAANGELKNLQWGGLQPGTKLGPLAPIFPRAPKELTDIMSEIENPTPAAEPSKPDAASAAPATPEPAPAPLTTNNQELTTPEITIDDFIKVELRVAEIKLAERIPKADKLLRLEVDLGPLGQRQILSGIAEHYAPEDLIGRRIIVITNLAPRKMRGLESHGMLLAASEEGGKPFLATVPEGVPVGTRLK